MRDLERGASTELLLVEEADADRQAAAQHFARQRFHVQQADNGQQALQLAKRHDVQVAVVDLDATGIPLLRRLKSETDCEVIVLAAGASIDDAVQAMKLGAFDFLRKPVRLPELNSVVQRAQKAASDRQLAGGDMPPGQPPDLPARNRQRRLTQVQLCGDMLGQSAPMQELYRLIRRVGPTEKPILIQGESGTGKELVARALHQASFRADRPMVVVNCAALPEMLLESELFGHERGAFTGAISAKPGLFEVADGGTLFIDEIGELAAGLQAKLLRVLEDGLLRRVGAVTTRHVDVRLLSATNRDLLQEAQQGRFREDLLYRVDVMRLQLPPLRIREDDIQLLAQHFAGDGWKIAPEAMQALVEYRWPGNVRQLSNAIERAKILADDQLILPQNLPPEVVSYQPTAPQPIDQPRPPAPDDCDLESLKRRHVEAVMRHYQGNKVRAARCLGISRRSLYRLLEKYHLAAAEQPVKPSHPDA